MDDIQETRGQGAAPAVQRTKEAVKDAAAHMTDTAKENVRDVAHEVNVQTRNVATELKDRVTEQARAQQENLAQMVRRTADELAAMAAQRPDSPTASMVSRVADGGHQMARYLDQHGPEAVLEEVRDFARRRPGAFLATALVSGFLVGRLGRGVVEAANGPSIHEDDARQTVPLPTARMDVRTSEVDAYADTLVYSSSTTDGVPARGGFR